jgi:hypothetical protein
MNLMVCDIETGQYKIMKSVPCACVCACIIWWWCLCGMYLVSDCICGRPYMSYDVSTIMVLALNNCMVYRSFTQSGEYCRVDTHEKGTYEIKSSVHKEPTLLIRPRSVTNIVHEHRRQYMNEAHDDVLPCMARFVLIFLCSYNLLAPRFTIKVFLAIKVSLEPEPSALSSGSTSFASPLAQPRQPQCAHSTILPGSKFFLGIRHMHTVCASRKPLSAL